MIKQVTNNFDTSCEWCGKHIPAGKKCVEILTANFETEEYEVMYSYCSKKCQQEYGKASYAENFYVLEWRADYNHVTYDNNSVCAYVGSFVYKGDEIVDTCSTGNINHAKKFSKNGAEELVKILTSKTSPTMFNKEKNPDVHIRIKRYTPTEKKEAAE